MLDRLVLHPGRVRFIVLGLGSAAFTALGWKMVAHGSWVGYLVGGFFGLCLIAACIHLVPALSSLTLDPVGFEIRTGFRRNAFRWSEIARFCPRAVGSHVTVGFDFKEGHPKRHPFGASFLGAMDAALPDTYGQSATDLAFLLEDWRAGRRRPPTSK